MKITLFADRFINWWSVLNGRFGIEATPDPRLLVSSEDTAIAIAMIHGRKANPWIRVIEPGQRMVASNGEARILDPDDDNIFEMVVPNDWLRDLGFTKIKMSKTKQTDIAAAQAILNGEAQPPSGVVVSVSVDDNGNVVDAKVWD